jgi:hypothetical protein
VVVDKGDVHDHKSDKTATSDNADQPSKDLGRAIGNLEEGEEREKHGNTEAIYRDTRLIAVSQESRGTAFERKRVESTGSAVGVCVTGGEDGRENQEVDEMRETSNAKVGHGNDIGRGSSIASSTSTKIDVIEGRVIVGTADANRKSTNNEKDAESIVDSLKGILDGKGRALGLGRDHWDVLGAYNSEWSAEEGGEETLETTLVALAEVCSERAGVGKVSKAVGVVLGVTTAHGDESKGKEDENEDELSTREPKLGFTIETDGEDVEKTASMVSISW